MDSCHSRRKRRHDSVSASAATPEPASPVSCRKTRQSQRRVTPDQAQTPRQPKKKVRFSDPGPLLRHDPDGSTGLTPALHRTCFQDASTPGGSMPRTPSRRRSTPLPRSRRAWDFPGDGESESPGRVVQFTPLRQMLTPRTQRRLRRVGLSDEMNQIEREKRETARDEKTLQRLLQERDELQRALEQARKSRTTPESPATSEHNPSTSPQARIQHLESENSRLREEVSFSSADGGEYSTSSNYEGDTIMINGSTLEGTLLEISDSPDMRGLDDRQLPTPDDLSLVDHGPFRADASTQASAPDYTQDAELLALSLDLEAARREKTDLFHACRSRLASFGETDMARHLQQSSPPPEFSDSILSTLTEALSRASDAVCALDAVKQEISSMGFPGTDVQDMVAEMRERFRSARLQLERAIPGETPSGLDNGNSTLSILVKRVEILVKALSDERHRHEGSAGREKALRKQFDALLVRYEAAVKKIRDLEESIASSAGDMLHTRMRMQELERAGEEQTVGIDRLNSALNKYRDEVKSLEALVSQLEDDKLVSNDNNNEQVSRLEKQVVAAELTVSGREVRIRELEETVEQNRIYVCNLTAQVELLEKDRQRAIEGVEKRWAEEQHHHDRDMGFMNVRVSELTTRLQETQSEMAKLRRTSEGLEEQLHVEISARDSLLDRWAEEQSRSFAFMKETVNKERRKAKARTANWEIKSDELQSDGTNLGSEPITPVSMTRFVDVEVGRGKHRRRLDSGIGILTDDGLLEEDGDVDEHEHEHGVQVPPSDPADL